MSWAKFVDLLKHLWLPVIILAIAGMANIIRTLRYLMLDELRKQYVTVARSKGLSEYQTIISNIRCVLPSIRSSARLPTCWHGYSRRHRR